MKLFGNEIDFSGVGDFVSDLYDDVKDKYKEKFGTPFWSSDNFIAVDFSAPFSFIYGMDQWLYGSWNKEKYETYTVLDDIPGVSDYMDNLLDRRTTEEYLDRYGLDYTDIHDPRKLPSSKSSSFVGIGMSSLQYVSKNVNKLYR